MSAQNNTFENVKLPKKYTDVLRGIKQTTGVPMVTYITMALDEKFKKDKIRLK